MSKATKMVVDKLIADLQERPLDFICDRYHLDDKLTGYSYWVNHGAMGRGIYHPYKMNFGFIQGLRFLSALNKWKAWSALNAKPLTQD